ncbi:hypothetical protein PGTUg99_032384 [Puccinia graminis f. sp. tritici]|uniref:Uncharacterized protein n=1 Tax=Puccinia graminis f. sp. tritici TaxID=56615 RepID=A0A5B0QS49_PUCGR|nr:hypothetical protein PGTUg99_032384 [Puccinia graminis f. sp. tritici]
MRPPQLETCDKFEPLGVFQPANLDGNHGDSANCCTGSHNTADTCPKDKVQFYDFFKNSCPDAYAYAYDESSQSALWTCNQSADPAKPSAPKTINQSGFMMGNQLPSGSADQVKHSEPEPTSADHAPVVELLIRPVAAASSVHPPPSTQRSIIHNPFTISDNSCRLPGPGNASTPLGLPPSVWHSYNRTEKEGTAQVSLLLELHKTLIKSCLNHPSHQSPPHLVLCNPQPKLPVSHQNSLSLSLALYLSQFNPSAPRSLMIVCMTQGVTQRWAGYVDVEHMNSQAQQGTALARSNKSSSLIQSVLGNSKPFNPL